VLDGSSQVGLLFLIQGGGAPGRVGEFDTGQGSWEQLGILWFVCGELVQLQ